MTASTLVRSSIVSAQFLRALFSLLVSMSLLGCAPADPPDTAPVRQRVETVADCVYDHVVDLLARDKSMQPSLSWNADNTVATVAVRDATSSVRATYRVEWRWDTVSIQSRVTDLTANEASIIAREATMHDICLSAGGF